VILFYFIVADIHCSPWPPLPGFSSSLHLCRNTICSSNLPFY